MAKRATIGLDLDINSRSVSVATARTNALDRATGKLTKGLGALAAGATALGVAVTAAAAGVLKLTMDIAAQADEIAKHSTRIGVTVESYQELSHAMELSGGSIGETSSAIRRLSGNMLDASQGVSTAVDAFAGLGIETATAAGGLRSVDDVLADIADEFAAMENGSLKTARAMELFGRSGAALIPFLNQGSEGIAEMRQEAHDLGLVISDETAAAAEALNDDVTRLRGVAGGFAREIATELIPTLRDMANSLLDAVRGSQDLAGTIADLSGDALQGFVEILRTVATTVTSVTQTFLWWKMAYEVVAATANDSAARVDQFGNSIASSAQQTQDQIEALARLQQHLENMSFAPSSMGVGGFLEDFASGVARATRLATAPDIDPDPGRSVPEAARELDKFELAAKNASAAVLALNTASAEASAQIQESMAAAAADLQAIFDTKEMEHANAERMKQMTAYADATKDAGKQIQKEVEDIGSSLMTVEDVGSKAIGSIVSGLQGLSMAAFWKKDGDALKEFGKMLGKMLIQLGTMAVAYAGVAALGTVFPVLQGVVGPAAGAPALAAVGAGAIAAGALLGAAIPRGAGGGGQPSGGGDVGRPVETSRTTVYNLTLGAGMSQRGMNRALLEQVNSAVGQGV
jgi:methyl-accepting chemotaxis protein